MYLTKYTDYSFRVLIYLAKDKNKVFIVEDLSKELKISEHHLKRIIWTLAKTDLVISMKGRVGGIKLGLDPRDINLGEVLKITEGNLNIAECFNKDNCCPYINTKCKLKGVMQVALDEFINEFSKFTLLDLL